MGERKRHSWQWWELLTRIDQPGTIMVRARATDLAGRTQPDSPEGTGSAKGTTPSRKCRFMSDSRRS